MIAAPTMAELLREKPQDNSAYVEAMRQLRAAAIEAERVLGGPVYIADQVREETDHAYVTVFCFRRVDMRPPGT